MRRMENIQWVKDLELSGLEYEAKERRIHTATTREGERICIQYPGKESKWKKNANPRDFRPILLIKNEKMPDLQFRAVWRIILEKLEPLSPTWDPSLATEPDLPRALALLFYRMAFMLDHVKRDPHSVLVEDISSDPESHQEYDKQFPALWDYEPPMPVVEAISQTLPELWGNMSLEAFLHYNDKMAWNEDCKYYHRQVRPGSKKWINDTGRVNTLLTHVRVIGAVTGDVRLSDLLDGFSRVGGVSPATPDEISRICAPLIIKEKPNDQSKLT